MIRAIFGAVIAVAMVACGGAPSRKGESSEEAARFNMQLGIAYMQKGNLRVAKEKLDRALKESPRDPNVHSALGMLSERLGNAKEADSHYRTAVRLAPKNPEISNNYAVYLCRTNRTEEGVERFLEVARNPLYRQPEAAYTNAGVCLRAADRLDEAEENFRRALRIRPNYAEAAYQLGNLEFERGRFKEARDHIDSFLGAFNATPELLLLGVRSARALGDRLGAERYARRLRIDFPESQQTRALIEINRNPG